MKKILILSTIILVIVLSGCKKEIIQPNVPCVNVTHLDKDTELDPGQIPQGTWEEKKCPSGDNVIYIDLIKGEDKWRKALYCEKENYFWIADSSQGVFTKGITWYGVYDGKPCGINS